jgi:hypothetical protein
MCAAANDGLMAADLFAAAAAKSSGRFAADREIFAIQASCPQLS